MNGTCPLFGRIIIFAADNERCVMKKCITLLLVLLAFAGTRANEVLVGSASALRDSITNNPAANIRLTADIDLSTIGTIDITFRGTIDGQGEKDGNPIFYSLGTSTDRVMHPIFKVMENATLENLVIQNFRVEWDDDNIGAVACTAKNCHFNQIVVSEVSIFNDDDYAGAIVGRAENCEFLNVKCMGNDVTVDGNRAGGFVGISNNSFYCNCSNSAYSTVYADGSWGYAYAGGFVGESESDQFVFCVNFASIGALDDSVGGLVGYSTMSTFTNCTNSGLVMHCKEKAFIGSTNKMKANIKDYITSIEDDLKEMYGKQDFDLTAGFVSFIGTLGLSTAAFGVELGLLSVTTAGVGAFAATVIIAATGITVSLINLIDAELFAHDEMGGICGSCQSSKFNTCSNYGKLMCIDSYVGGIVGYIKDMMTNTQIINCLNAGDLKGYELVGGIVGQCNNRDEVNHCLNVGKVVVVGDGSQSDPIANVSRSGDNGLSKNYYSSSRYDVNATGRIPVTADMLVDGTVAEFLNDDAGDTGPWRQNTDDKYPVPDPSHSEVNLRELGDVYLISTLEDLDKLRNDVNNGVKNRYIVYFEKDIDCSGTFWVPIGTKEKPFIGYCNGDGHTISNLTTDPDNLKSGVGFFGVVGLNTKVCHLFIGSGSITGGIGVGAIIGYAEHKTDTEGYVKIIGCGNSADITGNYDCGGLIGGVYSDPSMKLTIENCYNTGNVTANKQSAAICGFGKRGAEIRGSWNSGIVIGTESGMGFARGDNDITVQNCHNYGSNLGQTGVSAFSDDDAKNGTLCFNLNGGSNDASVGLPWEQDITTDEYPRYVGYSNDRNAVYATREIKSNYGTIVLPYSVKSDDCIRYYTLSGTNADGSQLNFTAVDVLEAGTPAIFRVVKPDTVYSFISIDYNFDYKYDSEGELYEPVSVDGWEMNGNLDITDKVFANQTELKSLYYISGGEIKSATTKLTVAPFRAYLTWLERPENSPLRVIGVSFDDGSDTTGLQFIPAGTHDDGSVELGLYNLAGQRLDAPGQGIVIINGKKVLNM